MKIDDRVIVKHSVTGINEDVGKTGTIVSTIPSSWFSFVVALDYGAGTHAFAQEELEVIGDLQPKDR